MSNCEKQRSKMLTLISLLLLLLCARVAPQPAELEVEQDTLSCPSSCVCQYAAFNELPIARWVNHLVSDYDESYYGQAFTKLATCLLQAQSETEALLQALPMDLQALILLYTGVEPELTVNSSSLKLLNQLSTLEMRGSLDAGSLRLVIDEPLDFLLHANFEHMTLLGSDQLQRPEYSELPSDNYDYKPRGELEETPPKRSDSYQLEFEASSGTEQLELQILPYERYVQLMKKTRMPSFYGWTRLEVLRVHDCQLSELHWQMFDGLAALQHLSLERNAIESLPPFALFGALHIKTLSLAHNDLEQLHYRALAGLLQLEVLDLSDNRLQRLSERSFPPLPRLQRADFRKNPVRQILPATFWVMNDTRELHFGSAEAALELWGNQPFDSLHKLRELSLMNVSAVSLEQSSFKGLHALESLTLRGDIRSVEFDAFSAMGQLLELDLSHCGIRQMSMDALLGCKQLKRLNLAHNQLSHVPPGLLDEQTQLVDIQLQFNQLRTLPSSFFLQSQLRLVRLHDNPWQCSCDMANWVPRVTNAVRSPSVERCVRDFATGQPISCRRVDAFEQDKSLAPRCSNYNGRSVYYVLRKQLQCGGTRVVRSSGSTRGLPHWRKVEQLQREKKPRKHKKKQQHKRKHQPNSLEFALRQRHSKEEVNHQLSEQQLSNEI